MKINNLLIILILAALAPSFQRAVAEVPVYVMFGDESVHNTMADSIVNSELIWQRQWFILAGRGNDGLQSIVAPRVTLKTDHQLPGPFWPNQGDYFTQSSCEYGWDFGSSYLLKANESYGMSAVDNEIMSRTRFSASRTVTPLILKDLITEQIVTLAVKFEEPLQGVVNSCFVQIGKPVVPPIYGYFNLITTKVVDISCSEPTWEIFGRHDSAVAIWDIPVNSLEVGKTYFFTAKLNISKLDILSGSPTYLPPVCVAQGNRQLLQNEKGQKVTISHPDGATITWATEDTIEWHPAIDFDWLHFWFDSRITTIVPDGDNQPHVQVAANVRVEPETLNLGKKGVITAFITLPEPYLLSELKPSTLMLCGALATKTIIASEKMLIAKFRVEDLRDVAPGEVVNMNVSGELLDGTLFIGHDQIRIIK